MKRKWLLILISSLLILALAACTKADAPSAVAEQPQSQVESDQPTETSQDDASADSDNSADAAQEPTEEAVSIDAAAIYAERCASCHGANREGGGGPALLPERLTKDPSAYKTTITNGSGPMPAWGSRLSAEEIDALVEFILSDPQ